MEEKTATLLALKNALFVASFLPEKEHRKDILNQLATTYHATGQLDSAIFYFQQLIDLKKGMNDTGGLISDFTALGNLHRERGSYDLAHRQYLDVLPLAKENQDTFALMTIYTEMGDLNETQKMYAAAEDADALVIATEWSVFRTPDFEKLVKKLNNKVIFDGRNLYDLDQMEEKGFYYSSIGRSLIG